MPTASVHVQANECPFGSKSLEKLVKSNSCKKSAPPIFRSYFDILDGAKIGPMLATKILDFPDKTASWLKRYLNY